jgi:type VI secretion system ImpC/EvpB family protein
MSAGPSQNGGGVLASPSAAAETNVSLPAPAMESADRSPSVLESVLRVSASTRDVSDGWLQQFLQERSTDGALRLWIARSFPKGGAVPTRQEVIRQLSRELAELERILERQVNAILHCPELQQLEASWRGLWFLTNQVHDSQDIAEQDGPQPEIQVRVLNVSKRALYRDMSDALEFDQSQIFKKVYEDGFGTAGGNPIGVLIGDYQFTNHVEDIEMLTGLSQVAAASFAPLITAASPELLGLEKDFRELERPIRLSEIFSQVDYLKWRAFRDSDESCFVGLTLPRVLMRIPYGDDGSRRDGFRFREEAEARDRSRYLWGNASYAFGSVLARAFCFSRWFAEIRGFERQTPEEITELGPRGGLVAGLPVHSFCTDRSGVVPKSSVEVALSEYQEKELTNLGFIPLCHCKDTEYSVFYSNASAQKPKKFADEEATANANISAMLQYVLCASRFAHYLKVLSRNKIGAYANAPDLQRHLNNWIQKYVTDDEKADPKIKSRHPLRKAQVEVRETPSKPGSFGLVMHLLPHYQLDGLTATLKLVMKMGPPGQA